MKFTFISELWLYPGNGAWVFATLPLDVSKEIKSLVKNLPRRGFGSIKIIVTIDNLEWKTSIFPDNESGSYLLPIKKEVRSKKHIGPGDKSKFVIKLVDFK